MFSYFALHSELDADAKKKYVVLALESKNVSTCEKSLYLINSSVFTRLA